MTLHHFSFPTAIEFGAGARRSVAPHLAERGVARPLVVTDRGLAALPLIAEMMQSLSSSRLQAALFSGVSGNPTASQVMAAAAGYRSHGADCVVGIGGGAALDV
ncbi:MAG TPA: iron-containing alcohol dehydrogenase, partial [Caldimonas sp.]|nr:iron-containing alcohol dehydrogenase [Caldimonas sp.]